MFTESRDKPCFRGGQGCSPCWQPDLVRCKHHPEGTSFEGIKGSWRTAEVWYHERPGEVTGEGTVSVALEDPGVKGSYKDVES